MGRNQGLFTNDCKHLLLELLALGYTINSITIDGKRGLYRTLKDYHVQMCHFHQKRITQRYITKKPKLKASKELQQRMQRLTSTNETIFTKNPIHGMKHTKISWLRKHSNEETGEERFKHAKLLSEYRSLRTNLPYLFSYKKHKCLDIHNTTNSLDCGVFSPMKMLIKLIED